MVIAANRRTYQHKYSFIVEVDGVAFAGFNKCSPLEVEVGEISYSEGGSLVAQKMPGRITFADITLERGMVIEDSDLYDWLLETANAAGISGLGAGQGTGSISPNYYRNLVIVAMGRDGIENARYNVYNAFPKTFTAIDGFDNESDEVAMEKMVLAVEWWEKQ